MKPPTAFRRSSREPRVSARPRLTLACCGLLTASAFTLLAAFGAGIYYLQLRGTFGPAVAWLAGAFALVVIFGVGGHIVRMAFMALRRRILNQHVLVEFGAFAGLAGGGRCAVSV